jgi:amino acid adenylation domain-containing protein
MTAWIAATGFQAGLWYLNQARPDLPKYAMPIVLRFRGPADPAGIRAALRHLTDVHDILRLRFASDDRGVWLVPAEELPEPVTVDLSMAARPEDAWDELVRAELARPIDLSRGAGHRSVIATLGEAGAGVVLMIHHAYGDARSVDVLLSDLREAYKTWEHTGALPPVRAVIPYAEVAAHFAAARPAEASRRYWQETLDAVPDFAPPADRPRPAERDFAAARLKRPLPDGFIERIDDACRTLRASRFMVLAAAWAATLHRRTAGVDPVLAIPQTLRRAAWQDDVVAPLLNTVPLHLPVRDEQSFRDLVLKTRLRTAAAMQHSAVPFEEIGRSRRGGSSGPALTSTAFQVSAAVLRSSRAGAVTIDCDIPAPPAGDMDLAWDILTEPGRDLLSVCYATELYDPETIENLADEFLAFTDALVEQPDVAIRKIEHRSDAYVAELWSAGETPADRPSDTDVATLFSRAAQAHPGEVAVVRGTRRWTYAELDARVSKLADRLAGARVGRGQTVALHLSDAVDAITGMLAVLRCGAAYVPFDPDQPAARSAAVLRVTRPVAALVGEPSSALSGLPQVRVDDVDGDAATAAAAEPLDSGSRCCFMSTSGTTGEPKVVAVTHAGVASLVSAPGYLSIGPGDALLQLAPLSFDAATFEVFGALLNGATLVVPERPKPTVTEIGRLVQRHRITVLHLTAGLMRVLADGDLSGLAGLRTLLTGGDAISVPHLRRIVRAHPSLAVVGCYGPTENATFSSVNVQGVAPDGAFLPLGTALPGRSLHVLDALLRPVSPGGTGEVYVGGVGLADGYVGGAGRTAERFVAHPRRAGERLYRTGDKARWCTSGAVEFLGRDDGQLKIRGHRVEPAEVVAALSRHPLVLDCLVRARGSAGDRTLAAYVVPRTPGLAADVLRTHLRTMLPEPLVPTGWWLLDAFPVTPNGKVDTRVLDCMPVPASSDEAATPPRTETERVVHALWCDALDRDRISVSIGFFAAGGHSLAALRIAGQAEKRFGRPVPLAEVLGRPTIEEFAAWLDSAPSPVVTDASPSPSPSHRSAVPLDDLDVATDEELAAFRLLTGADPISPAPISPAPISPAPISQGANR